VNYAGRAPFASKQTGIQITLHDFDEFSRSHSSGSLSSFRERELTFSDIRGESVSTAGASKFVTTMSIEVE
jgi:hypothetical protein